METNWVCILSIFILVTIWHELGHLCVAQWLAIPIKRIGIGFGPTLWRSPVLGGTEFVLRALPLGMSIGVPGRRDEQGQLRRPIAHDIWVAMAGPLTSFLLSALLFALLYMLPMEAAIKDWMIGVIILSALVGALNLLPVPGLDGGHLLILSIACTGWQLSSRHETRLNQISMQVMITACLLSVVIQTWQWLII